ncbi:DEAD/DEAH box helicase [Kitasatospora purpeofusca]|uniref:DEAD/DEAH box helicase n=1 Tax=Kitasatospora purpeofusca TaxID=67352 RepID=UPI0004C266E2|nr:DEAD/DEAH box helicase [Kitasatospora purpeofusca]
MERTLSLPVLREALGSLRTSTLPSPEELMRLIADIEVRAMMNRFEVDDSVLRTAWYLHGVAALPEAAERYNPARQRHAFAVSAHIFDLALADTERPAAELLSLAFGAQIGYRRCDQDPNATAVWRRVADLCHGPDPLRRSGEAQPLAALDAIETLSVEAGVAFLGFDTGRLWDLLRHWRRRMRELQDLLGLDDLQGTLFGPTQDVVNAVADLTNFLVFGARDRLRRAHEALERVVSGRSGRGDVNAQWVAAHLLRLLGDLGAGSLHELLPPDARRAVAQAFTLTSPPVLTLWPPQRELLSRGSANPLDPSTSRLLVSVPTSAGKSLISQLIMCSHLATVPGRVVYVSPLRSLTREMRRSLRERLRVLDRELDADVPEFPGAWQVFGPTEEEPADVEVITPERLMHSLRNDPETALKDVTLIVVDEAHHIAQGKRGFLLEGLLAFCQTYPDAPRLVLLSAAVGNGAALASWLAPGTPEVLFTSAWRGPRRLHGLLSTTPSWDEQSTTARPRSADLPWQTSVPLSVGISLRPAESMTPIQLSTQPVGELVLNHPVESSLRGCKKDKSKSTAAYKMFAAAATLLLPAGAMLVVAGTKDLAQSTAMAMAKHLPEFEPALELAQLFAEQLGEEHPLVGCTRHGVAFHHAALPDDVLEAVEDALRGARLLAVASTSTLTDGVNLPVRTVLITADLDSEETNRGSASYGLDPARLLNAVGRAGRAGQESEGWILLALNRETSTEDYNLFSPDSEQLQVRSALASHAALEALAAAEAIITSSADDVMAVAQGMAADFISFVWFVLDAHAHLEAAAPDPIGTVDRLLAMQQLPDQDRARWYSLAQTTRHRYAATNPASRRRWTSAGTSLRSARTLDGLARRVAQRAATFDGEMTTFDMWSVLEPDELTLAETLQILEEEQVYEALLQLPEREKAWQFRDRRRGRNRQAVQVDLAGAITRWVNGTPIPAMAREWLPNAEIDWALEQAVSNISVTFEHYLSWTVGALINMANEELAHMSAPLRLRTTTAWCLRYGVDTEQALHLLIHGVRSRTLAYNVGQWAAYEDIAPTDLGTQLASQHIPGWHDRFRPTALEIDDLLEYVRRRRRSLLPTLLKGDPVELEIEPDLSIEPTPGRVSLVWTNTKPAREILITDDHRTRGRIAARDHADVAAALRSGLVIDAILEGTRLRLSHAAADQ